MAELNNDPEAYFAENLSPNGRVLLINPPVEEKRYHWVRWNQPLELLRLSTWLKTIHPRVSVELFDFMLPDGSGKVRKHKVKDTWAGKGEQQLWHFGRTYEEFEAVWSKLRERSLPECVVISSLTSYWHASIEKLLIKLCNCLGRETRKRMKIVLYGNYPRFEPEHAATQQEADVALTRTVITGNCLPDFRLYIEREARLPSFFALDVEAPDVSDHLTTCLDLAREEQRRRRGLRQQAMVVAFFNDDVCSPKSQLPAVVEFAEANPGWLSVEGIAGIQPRSLSRERLEQLKRARFRSLFVEHARLPGGGLDEAAYEPLLKMLRDEEHEKKSPSKKSGPPASPTPWLENGGVTGFVNIGLPDDNMDELVRSTLLLNQYFQAIVIKPFGYSPDLHKQNSLSSDERRARWQLPRESSPQWYPYAGWGSALSQKDYDDLMRWQGLLNKRVRGTTFDFLDDGNVAKMVRETLIFESWKPRMESR